jgi:phospholipid/cholesterol/gamma-HCH transport system substrate-binding protein
VQILPTTLAELRPTLDAVAATSVDAAPVIHDLRPGGRVFGSALRDTARLAPQARAVLADVDSLASAARAGLPAATAVVNAARPVFEVLDPGLAQLIPVVDYLGLYKHDLITSFANLAAATEAAVPDQPGGEPVHYLRVVVPFTQEGLAYQAKRTPSNRHNPYFGPQPLLKLPQGLDSFDCSNASGLSTQAAPACKVQQPLGFEGKHLAYPHVDAEASASSTSG